MLRCQPCPDLSRRGEHRDAAGRLHDAAEAAAECGSELRQPAGQAALPQRDILRPPADSCALYCTAAEARRGAARVPGRSCHRRRPEFVLHRAGRLCSSATECAFRGSDRLRLEVSGECARRRIDDQRRARPDVLSDMKAEFALVDIGSGFRRARRAGRAIAPSAPGPPARCSLRRIPGSRIWRDAAAACPTRLSRFPADRARPMESSTSGRSADRDTTT